MNILQLEGLPLEYNGYPVSADFRNMINVELIFNDESLPEQHRLLIALNQLFPEVPKDFKQAIDGLVWFYSRGEVQDSSGDDAAKKSRKGYDFEQDADYIYSSFCTAYGIRLAEVEFMHWWEFLALFQGLPADSMMKKIIYWRTADLSKLSKEEKKHVTVMRELFALKRSEKERMTIEELNWKTQEYYDARTKGV